MFFSFTSQEVIMPVTVCEARGSIKAHPALKENLDFILKVLDWYKIVVFALRKSAFDIEIRP